MQPLSEYRVGPVFNAAVADQPPPQFVPLRDRGVIPVKNHLGFDVNVVNFRYIIQTGNIPAFPDSLDSTYSIDLNRDDPLTQALATMEAAVLNSIENRRRDAPDFRDLMEKPVWSKQDRQDFESYLSDAVSTEMDKIKGLQDYRTIPYENNQNKELPLAQENIRLLNDLSYDIEHGSQRYRFDCGVQSIIEGIVIQRVEDQVLTAENPADNYKAASSYFYSGGTALFNEKDNPGQHAYIFTPSGTVIEATADPSKGGVPYSFFQSPNTLEQYIKGRPFIGDGAVYDPAFADLDGMKALQEIDNMEQRGEVEGGQTVFQVSDINSFTTQGDIHVLDAREHGFMFVDERKANGEHNLSVYQEQNIESPSQGYVFVASASGVTEDGQSLSAIYTDALTQQSYMFMRASTGNEDKMIMMGEDENGNFKEIKRASFDSSPLSSSQSPEKILRGLDKVYLGPR